MISALRTLYFRKCVSGSQQTPENKLLHQVRGEATGMYPWAQIPAVLAIHRTLVSKIRTRQGAPMVESAEHFRRQLCFRFRQMDHGQCLFLRQAPDALGQA